ncbi:epoxyqueuosine reductase QueH [Candidatus Falkowbacteria bacterium]|nr:epoxyqueuosine reductase QueH [Candidatus Falkowbacteria bacterium]
MKLLLHVCCATCLAGVLSQLKEYKVTCFFYNPNIHPSEEYQKRLNDVASQCKKLNIPLIQGYYDKDRWFELTKGHERDPEGGTLSVPIRHAKRAGQRCHICYTMRLEQTALYGRRDAGVSPAGNFDLFTTTLTISPHKKAEVINKIGRNLAKKYKTKFLPKDFKKHDGFKHACEIAKKENFYRQNYCGCVFSINKKDG